MSAKTAQTISPAQTPPHFRAVMASGAAGDSIGSKLLDDAAREGCAPPEEGTTPARVVPELRPLSALDTLPEVDPGELFRDRFLCAGGAALLAAATGVGKSTFVCGLTLHAAAGLPYLGLRPVRALRTWIVGAENDDHDTRDFFRGAEFQLVREAGADATARARENVRFALVNTLAGEGLAAWLGDQLEQTPATARPDVLVLDPAFAYIGGDAMQQTDVSAFLRGLLNPLLTRYRLGLLLVHHSNKPRRDQGGPAAAGSDFAYLGAGSAEFANWARAVLALLPTPLDGVFELRAGKRGGRLGWTGPDGTRTCRRHVAHSAEPGEPFFWRDATPEEIAALPADKRTGAGRPGLDIDTLCRAAAKLCKRRMPLARFKDTLREETGIGRQACDEVVRRVTDADGELEKSRDGAAWYIRPRGLL